MKTSTISSALKEAKQSLSNHSAGTLEAEILLAYALKKSRSHLFAWPEDILNAAQSDTFNRLINRRRNGEPIAYLVGEKEFWSLPIRVTKDTLIPRAETERLIEVTLALTHTQDSANILDLGTGSGCIALALAKELPKALISACDQSAKALQVAKENAQTLKLDNIRFYLSDWFKDLPHHTFDVIVSNPPYIATNDPHLDANEIKYEPQTALVSGDDGLNDIRVIARDSKNYLSAHGLLILEIGHTQANDVSNILNELQFQNITFHKDLLGHPRICSAHH